MKEMRLRKLTRIKCARKGWGSARGTAVNDLPGNRGQLKNPCPVSLLPGALCRCLGPPLPGVTIDVAFRVIFALEYNKSSVLWG